MLTALLNKQMFVMDTLVGVQHELATFTLVQPELVNETFGHH